MKKILTNLITVLLFATALVALGELSPMERKAEHLKLREIKDPVQRIAAEIRFEYLGIEYPEAKRLENLGLLRARAEASPDEKWLFMFVFSDGLSADEVADIIDTFVLSPVRSIDAKLVKPDGRVLSVGLGDFDFWSGSSREILSYQMEQMRERGRFDGVLSKNERLIEDAFANQDLAQFYIIQGVTTAGNAEALRSTRASSIVRIDMFKDHESRMRATPPSMKLPLPSYEDQKSTRQILRMPSSHVRVLPEPHRAAHSLGGARAGLSASELAKKAARLEHRRSLIGRRGRGRVLLCELLARRFGSRLP